MIEPEGLVLVGVIPSPRDLEIARVLGWYRIPLQHAPKIVQVDYLAFYQTGAFPIGHRWKVEFIAAVKGVELVKRSQLFVDEPDHPRANDEYYKIQIADLQPLIKPIEAGNWKRFTFLYTTGYKLSTSTSLKDLPTRNRDRNILWKTLKERAGKYGWNIPDEPTTIDVPEEVFDLLKLLNGNP